MALTIRLAGTEDIPELAVLIPAAVRKLSRGYYTPAQIEAALVHVFGVDTQLIEDGTYYVAEVNGKIVGCGGWSRRQTLFGGDRRKGGAADPLLNSASDSARIRAFYVRPDWARKGIGSAILHRCEEAARAEGFMSAELVATLPGLPLYSAKGYAEIEPMRIWMGGGAPLPAMRMGKMF